MKLLFRLFANICKLKQGADAVPNSINLFIVLFLANLIIETLLGLSIYSFIESFLLSLLAITSLFAYIALWLVLFRLSNRLLQTITTLVGISLFTNIICFVPISLLWQFEVLTDNSFALLNLLLIAWVLAIYAHVFRGALNISFFLGLALAITFFISFNTLAVNIIGK